MAADSHNCRRQLSGNWIRHAHLLDRFEQCWQDQGTADIAEFLGETSQGAARNELLSELVSIDLEYRWRGGEQVRVESYLARFPELGVPESPPIALLAQELRVRRLYGDHSAAAELAGRYPERWAEVEQWARQFEVSPAEGIDEGIDEGSARGVGDPTRWKLCAPPLSEPPHRLGRYQLRERIGRGGFATVYRAIDLELQREVAVKVPQAEWLDEPGARARVLREAQTAARLRHPAIVPIHEVGEEQGTTYIIYELIRGPTLAQVLETERPAARQAVEWIALLAEALDYAHQHGIVHRDVKPANVMMAVADQQGWESGPAREAAEGTAPATPPVAGAMLCPKLTDFGLALHTNDGHNPTLTRYGDLLGTPAYMSPEQARGEGHAVDPRTDVYSLGVILYETLSGRRPFEGSGASVLQRVIDEEPPALRSVRRDVPVDLETICQRAMAKEVQRRYATAGAMAADLRAWLEHRPIRARRVGVLGRLMLWCRRKPALAATVAAAITVSSLAIAASFVRVVHERDRYRTERDRAEANLYHSLVRESRAIRLARGTGFRAEVWRQLQHARRLETPERNLDELRQEAVACLGDFVGREPIAWNPRSQPNDYVVAMGVPAESATVVLGLADGSVLLNDVTSGQERVRLRGKTGGVFDLVVDAALRTIAAADDEGGIWYWQRGADGQWTLARRLTTIASQRRNHVNAISLALIDQGRVLLACPFGAADIVGWDLATGEPIAPFRPDRADDDVKFLSVTASSDGRWLAAPMAAANRTGVVVWEQTTRKIHQQFDPGLGLVNRVRFSPDGRLLACACQDGVALFRTADFQRHLFIEGDSPYMVAFSPDSRWLAIPSPTRSVVRLWNVANNREVAVLASAADEPHTAMFSADGSRLLTASANWVRVWDLRGNGEKLVLAGHHGGVRDVTFTPDSRTLLSTGGDRSVKVWNLTTGQLVRSQDDWDRCVNELAVSPEGDTLATGQEDGTLHVWRFSAEGAISDPMPLEHDLGQLVDALAFSSNGRLLAAGAEHGVQIWNRAPAEQGRNVRRHVDRWARFAGNSVRGFRFSPDNQYAAWWDLRDNFVWKVDGGQANPVPSVTRTVTPGGMAFFADGRRLLVVNGTEALVVDVKSGRALSTLGAAARAGQLNWYQAGSEIALRPDGELLAVQYLSVPVFHCGQQRILFTLPQESDVASCLEWSPDGQWLAIGLSNGGLVAWNFPLLRRELAKIKLEW